jgi:hypothetical protein
MKTKDELHKFINGLIYVFNSTFNFINRLNNPFRISKSVCKTQRKENIEYIFKNTIYWMKDIEYWYDHYVSQFLLKDRGQHTHYDIHERAKETVLKQLS